MVKSVEVLGSGVYLILDRQQRREISFPIIDVITTIKEPIVSLLLHAGSIKKSRSPQNEFSNILQMLLFPLCNYLST